ncbi:MAG TPA: ATP-binding protein [Mycobacteriales bacterium]|nr:ATP-binding protein [Mycobacteriales bacterium]
MKSTAAAYVAAGALLVSGAIGAAVVERVAEDRAVSDARDRGRTTVEVFEGVMGDLTRTTGTIEQGAALGLSPTSVTRLLSDRSVVTGVSGLGRSSSSPVLRAGISAIPTGALFEGTRLARAAAADTGEMRVAVPAVGSIAFVLPKYADGAPVATTDERRANLSGWVLVSVDAEKFVRRLGATGAGVDLAVDGVPAAVGSIGSRNGIETTGEAKLANATWRITVRPDLPIGLSSTAWAVLVCSALAALGALGVGTRDRRRIDRIGAEHDALVRETRIVAELGPILQASLDLGEVLPAVAVHLCDEFGLKTVALELIGDDGSLVEVFSMGARPSRAGAEAAEVRVDELVCPLIRSGRTMGRLRVVPAKTLTHSEITAIRAGAELIAVTTSNVELYEREQATVRRLTELDRLKDAFLGTISHELRTPITAIRGFVQLLCERWGDFGDEDRQEFLRRIQRNSTSLGLLVDDLLDFARIERQSIVVTPTAVRLDLAAGSLVRQLTPLLGQHHIVTELGSEVVAVADVSAVDRVLANLLTNAAKFSPAGTTITIAARAAEHHAELVVSDEGPGIAEVDRPRIFTRFYRGDGAVAKATRGAGIGLCVVRELVVQMGGEISVEDNAPTGTRMVVRLPVPGGRALRIPDQLIPAPIEPARRP